MDGLAPSAVEAAAWQTVSPQTESMLGGLIGESDVPRE